jgi:hypothetical protein
MTKEVHKSSSIMPPIITNKNCSKVGEAEQSESIVNKKVEIPQCAIIVIENAKEKGHTLFGAMNVNYKSEEFRDWIRTTEHQELFARAWIEGYKLKEEKRYQVRLKGLDKDLEYLNFKHGHVWVFSDNIENEEYRTKHTRKELEEGGFGEVFNSPLFEIEEVK